MSVGEHYLALLKKRGRESRAYRRYQLVGLEIAQILHDEKHKSLYIKLAKEMGAERILHLAKEVGERKDIKNRGAYFMKIIQTLRVNSRKRKASSHS